MSKAECVQAYIKILRDEGFDPNLNAEGNIGLKFEGSPYTIEIDQDDDQYLRFTCRHFTKIKNARDHLGALIGALHATAETKVAKVCIVDGEIVASVELFVGAPEHLRPIIVRSLNALKSAVNRFTEFPPENYTSIF